MNYLHPYLAPLCRRSGVSGVCAPEFVHDVGFWCIPASHVFSEKDSGGGGGGGGGKVEGAGGTAISTGLISNFVARFVGKDLLSPAKAGGGEETFVELIDVFEHPRWKEWSSGAGSEGGENGGGDGEESGEEDGGDVCRKFDTRDDEIRRRGCSHRLTYRVRYRSRGQRSLCKAAARDVQLALRAEMQLRLNVVLT